MAVAEILWRPRVLETGPTNMGAMELRHRIFVTLFLLSAFTFAVWFAFVYTWPMTLDPSID